ncbi:MAG: ribonuclease III [Thiohalomonadales bacterium]
MQQTSTKAIAKLEDRLGYRFTNVSLLEQALTHRSKQTQNNERLEYLGDAVLGFSIAAQLYRQFSSATEGQLSRCRSSLVKGATLAEIAVDMNIGDYLRLGPGELKSGGFRRESTLADTFEAIIGAIYLDNGINAADDFIKRCFNEKLFSLNLNEIQKDPKTQLQELLQAQKYPVPTYEIVNTQGMEHQQTFFIRCHVSLLDTPTEGKGGSRRKAEQQAAAVALRLLK